MAISIHLIVCGLAILTVLASLAEIVLASRVLHYLHILEDETNYAVDGVAQSSQYPPGDDIEFEQQWVLVDSGIIRNIPHAELAAGALALFLGLVLCVYVPGRIFYSRKFGSRDGVSAFGPVDWVATVVPPFFAVTISVLFIYVFALSDSSLHNSHVFLNGPLGGVGWDSTPSWEDWTCTWASYLNENPNVPASRSEWNMICSLTQGARWTLLPIFLFTIFSVAALLFIQYRTARAAHVSPTRQSSKTLAEGMELDPMER